MGSVIKRVAAMQIFQRDLDEHLIRGSMILIYFMFGYQKWFEYEAQGLVPFFTHGPLIFWMIPAFGVRGASYFLGVSEWVFGALLLTGYWSRKIGIFGDLGSVFTFLCTVTIIPFFPEGWAAAAGGFPAMTLPLGFLMKDVVLLAASFYLLKQDLRKLASAERIDTVSAQAQMAAPHP